MRVYLAGRISDCSDEECNGWREQASVALKDLATTVNPMVRDARGREDEPGISKFVVEGDKADIDSCDAILVRYKKPSVGTMMEVIYAWEHGKRVILWVDRLSGLSPWLRYHSHAVVTSLFEAACVIQQEKLKEEKQ